MSRESISASKRKYREKHRGILREKNRQYRKDHPENGLQHTREQRYRALEIVGKGILKCVRCRCDDCRLLEINHKHGGGAKDQKGNRFNCDIISGRRSTDDLEILCKPCNAVHFLELKYGTLPFTVLWNLVDVVNDCSKTNDLVCDEGFNNC